MQKRLALISLATLIWLSLGDKVWSDTDLTGELGVDLVSYNFASSLKDTTRQYSTTRTRSGHFLDMTLSGPLGTSQFANYLLRGRAYGIYFDTRTDSSSATEYISPDLQMYSGNLTLFPSRPYPLKLFASKDRQYLLRYEANNRTDRDRVQPSLAVLRKYMTDRSITGAQLQMAPSQSVNLVSEIRQESMTINRLYDFEENRDFWVRAQEIQASLIDSVFKLEVQNLTLSPLTVTILNLDSLQFSGDPKTVIFEDIQPEMTAFGEIYAGLHEVRMEAPDLNTWVFQYRITDAGVKFRAEYKDPSAPNDLTQDQTSVSNTLKVEQGDRFKNETFYEYVSQDEAVQNQSTTLHNFSNNGRYEFSKTMSLDMLTTYVDNYTNIIGISEQKSNGLMHQSTLGYSRRRGLNATLLHSYSVNRSRVDSSSVKNTLNLITGRVNIPTNWNAHKLDVRGNISMLADDAVPQYTNDQYSVDVGNSAAFRYRGATLEPASHVKYAYNTQQNPTKSSGEVEIKSSLVTKVPSATIGDLRVKTEHTFRNRSSEDENDKRGRYLLDMTFRKDLGSGYKLQGLMTQEWETFGGSVARTGVGSADTRPTEHKSSYKIDLQTMPFKGLMVQGSFMLISQENTSIEKYNLSILGDIPKVNLPVKTFLLYEVRNLTNMDPQTQLSIETRTSFRVRHVSVVLKHSYRRENQRFETYSINDIQLTVARRFGVF